ncbi:DUF6029 family protein [bacterium]|nr:DUF6029 family protein [bacterium]
MLRSSARLAIALVAAIALAPPARAFELETPVTDSVAITETLKTLYDQTSPDEDLHFLALINRFNLQVIKSRFAAGVRYDSEFYFEQEQYRLKYWLEKAYVQYESPTVFVRAGDSHNRLGEGLVLALQALDEFGQDDTLFGGVAQVRDKGGHVELRALGGVINEGDDLSFKPERASEDEPALDERDIAGGGQIVAGMPGWGFASARFLGGVLQTDEDIALAAQEEDDPYDIAGAGLRWMQLGGLGEIYGEYAWYIREDRKKDLDPELIEGRGAYASMNLAAGPVTFLAEGQDYYRFDYPHAAPPILEFEKQTFGHLPDRTDILGARGLAEVLLPFWESSILASYYHARRHETPPDELADHYDLDASIEWAEHTYGGFDIVFPNGAHTVATAGYREEPEGRWVHGEFDFSYPLFGRHEADLAVRAKDFHGMDTFLGTEYGSFSVAPGWLYGGIASVTLRYERSDEPLAAGAGGVEGEDDPDFWSGEARLRAGEHVDLRAFYGRIKGGLVCSGGICRTVPPFDGAQLDVTLKF